MASASTSLSEEQFLCSICLDVFSDPVSTPCGHNYCKTCITNYWAVGRLVQCPLCQETFPAAPQLRVNTGLRDLVEVFKRSRFAHMHGDGRSPAGPGEVPCDLCGGVNNKALKSCLVCLASYCDAHLEAHRTVQALKWHTLINPVATLEDRVCKKHNKLMELFCSEDQTCVCVVCLRDDHVGHKAVSVEEEFQERKTRLKHMRKHVRRSLTEKRITADRIQQSVLQGRQEVERTKAETTKAFAALVASIETRKLKLLELLEEKQRAAEQQADALLGQLQLEIKENHQKSDELKNLLGTEDEFKLLQRLPSVSSPSNANRLFAARVQLSVEAVRSAVAKMEETLHNQMDSVIAEVNLVYEEEKATHIQTEKLFDDPLGKIQARCAVSVTLDADTAHPCLIVSGDGKRVRDVGTKRKVPDSSARFDTLHYVTGKEGFSSGQFYFEVSLKDHVGWEVGVAREPIIKRGVGLSLSPDHGCWTLGLYWGRYQANANPPVTLNLSKKPQRVGVFVDYEGGLVSFYDVDARALIYSFTRCAFTVALPFMSKLTHMIYTSIPEKTRIYPLLRPGGELQITPVRQTPDL